MQYLLDGTLIFFEVIYCNNTFVLVCFNY